MIMHVVVSLLVILYVVLVVMVIWCVNQLKARDFYINQLEDRVVQLRQDRGDRAGALTEANSKLVSLSARLFEIRLIIDRWQEEVYGDKNEDESCGDKSEDIPEADEPDFFPYTLEEWERTFDHPYPAQSNRTQITP